MQDNQEQLEQIKHEWARLDDLKLEDFSTKKSSGHRDTDLLGRAICLLVSQTAVTAATAAKQEDIDLGEAFLGSAEISSADENQRDNLYSAQIDGYEAIMEQLINLQEYDLIVRLTIATCTNNPEVEDILETAANLLLDSGSITNARIVSTFDFANEGCKIEILIAIVKVTGSHDDIEKARNAILSLENSSGAVCYLASLYKVSCSQIDLELARSIASALEIKDQIITFCDIGRVSHSLTDYAAAIDACFELCQEDQQDQLRSIVSMILLNSNSDTKNDKGEIKLPKGLVDAIKHPEMRQKVRQQFGLN